MLDFGESFAKSLDQAKSIVIELIGDVGAGKTTFTRGFAKGLGATKEVTSPSFTISKTYALPNHKNLVHYDFYRLGDPGLMQDDLAEKINENNIILIEWGKSINDVLPDNRIQIIITKNDDGTRTIETHAKNSTVTNTSVTNKKPTLASPAQLSTSGLTLYLDTSTPTTILKLNDKTYEWESGRELAEKLLGFIQDKLQENHKNWPDITKIIFMSGPGSFTGLRIGAAVINTLAAELNIPLYNHKGEKVKIILPDYGRDANITKPKK